MLVSRQGLKAASDRFKKLKLEYPQKFMHGVNNENVLGDYLTNCKNAWMCFDSRDLWDCRRNWQGWMSTRDAVDCHEVGDVQLAYESCYSGAASERLLFCSHSFYSHNLYYCSFCMHCDDCFGCVGLNRKKHCIFNKQYSKEEYEKLVPKIIAQMRKSGEWGEFYPTGFSDFAYNESPAAPYFPLTKEKATSFGYRWREADKKDFLPATTTVPDTIAEVQDAILQATLACEACGRNYRIMKRELDFLRRQKQPLPKSCFLCRHAARMAKRNPHTLHDRSCDNCRKPIKTSYSPDRPEKIFCEDCYLKAVY
jgi:hypothetical protein